MNSKILILGGLFLFAGLAAGTQFNKEKEYCPKSIKVKEDFELEKFAGRWYHIEDLPTSYIPRGTACLSSSYTSNGNETYFAKNTRVYKGGRYYELCGVAKASQKPGVVTIYMKKRDRDYFILDTDYENFGVVYSCKFMGGYKFEKAWILSRNTSLHQSTIDYSKKLFEDQNIQVQWEKLEHPSYCIYEGPSEESCQYE